MTYRGCKLMHLAPGKTVYLTTASQDFTASNFLVILPWTLFTLETIEEMALSVSQTPNSKSWIGMCELLRALSDSCCTCDSWVRKLEAMKPLERLSATLFTLLKVPKAHSEMCFWGLLMLTCLQCSGVKSTWDLPCCWKSWVGSQPALKAF